MLGRPVIQWGPSNWDDWGSLLYISLDFNALPVWVSENYRILTKERNGLKNRASVNWNVMSIRVAHLHLFKHSFVKYLCQVTLGWHQVPLQSNQHKGPYSPIMHPLPCERKEREHYTGMLCRCHCDTNGWLTCPPTRVLGLCFPGGQRRRNGWMTSLSGAEGGKAASMSKHVTAMHCKTTTEDYKLLGFRSTNQSNKSSWCESFQRKYLAEIH